MTWKDPRQRRHEWRLRKQDTRRFQRMADRKNPGADTAAEWMRAVFNTGWGQQ